jgi:hypothetical protein
MTDIASPPGTPVTDAELRALGFAALELQFSASPILLRTGVGCSWASLGAVPGAPGLYAFVVSNSAAQHVTYVGRTVHLWMVTKGRLPRGRGARPGQRYGRPCYAGETRQRINIEVAGQRAPGHQVHHWVSPRGDAGLAVAEEELITRWRLRTTGWNRG